MKAPPVFCARRLLSLLVLALTLGLFAVSDARAGLTVDIHLYHDTYGYYFYPYLNTNGIAPDFPDGNYMIASPQIPTGGSQLQYQATNGTFSFTGGGGNYYGDFNSFLYGITNGQWSIWVTNSTSTNQYQFTVTVSGVTSNSFGAPVLPVFPLDGAANVTNQPLFQWTGPVGWTGTLNDAVYFIDTNGNYNYEASASLPPDQTSWPCPVVLSNSTNDFSVDYSSNATALIIAATPQDNASQPISGWSSTATLETSYDIRFTVGMIQGQVNLVANGGFETGDFTDWTVTGGGNFVDDASGSGITPHSGNYEAAFGAVGELDDLSQTLPTTPGASYLLSFWLNSPDGQTPNEFQVSWNGITLFDQTNLPTLGWTNLQFMVTATGTATVLQFGGQDDPSYLALDDISVVPAGGITGGHKNVAHYAFDNSGNLGQDGSGNGNDMAPVPVTWGPTYQFNTNAEAGGGAVQFFGTSALFASGQTMTNLNAVLAGSFTMSAWVKTTVTNGADFNNAFFGAGIFWAYNYQGNTNDTIPLAITGSKAAFTTRDHLGNSTTLHSISSVNDGNYHLITVTRDQGTGEKKIYVDGNFETSEIGTTDPLNGNNYNLTIGGYAFCTDGGCTNFYAYNGLLDDVQVYTGVLSDAEVASLYANPGTSVPDTTGQDFNAALNNTNLTWTTSGDANWFVETTNTSDGVSAAQSGIVTNSQTSTISTTVTGPGTLTFYWSSQETGNNFDYVCYKDGDPNNGYLDDIYYDTAWYQDGPFNIPAGQHTISWTAYSNGDNDPTQAGFLDQVSYVAAPTNSAPVITVNPFNQTNYPGYNAALYAAATSNPTATWQWFEVGSGLIAGATTNLYIPTNSGTAGVAGSYYAVASNIQGSANTTTAAVTFVSEPLPPDWSLALKSPFQSVDSSQFNKDYYLGCAVDPAGDVYVAAQYFGNMNVLVNFSPENVLTAVGTNGAAALVKHDANGQPIWGVGLTNNNTGSSSHGTAVAVAPGNGAYLASVLTGTNWLGTNKFVDTGGSSILLSRFDASGSNVWSQFIGGTSPVDLRYNMLVSDVSGNIILAGKMYGIINFGGTNLSAPSGGGFIIQYDANGNVRWAQTFPDFPLNLAYNNGKLYVSLQSSSSSGVTSVSIGAMSNVTDRAWGVACLNAANGQALWLQGVGGQSGANQNGVSDDVPLISVSGSDVFLTGTAYGSSAVFGGLSVSWPGTRGQYFARYDTNGNPQMATNFGSPTTATWAAAASASGVYVCGDFDSYSTFGSDVIAAPVYATNDLGPNYFTQPFLAKFDRNGNPLWARNGVSPDLANFRGITTTSDGVWAAGFLKTTSLNLLAQFGTNYVYGDYYIVSAGILGTIFPTQGGMIAKITDTDANPVSVNLTMNIYRQQSTSFGDSFYVFPNFNSVTPAATGTTTNTIESPTLKFHGEINTSGNQPFSSILFSIDQLNNEFTNGLWSLYINKGLPNERLFHFTATVNGLTTNLLPAVTIITPTNGAASVPPNSPFQWFGPSNFSSLNVNKQKYDGSEQASALLAVTATNWPSPPAMSAGTNRFSITYTANNFPNVAFTVPVDTNSLSVSNWVTQFNLLSTAASIFVVSSGASPVQLVNVSQTGGNFQFSFTSSAGFTNAILYRTNLVSGTWQTYSNVIGDGTVKNIAVPLSIFSPSKQGFIRVSTQ